MFLEWDNTLISLNVSDWKKFTELHKGIPELREKYRLTRLVGQGSFAAVFAARVQRSRPPASSTHTRSSTSGCTSTSGSEQSQPDVAQPSCEVAGAALGAVGGVGGVGGGGVGGVGGGDGVQGAAGGTGALLSKRGASALLLLRRDNK